MVMETQKPNLSVYDCGIKYPCKAISHLQGIFRKVIGAGALLAPITFVPFHTPEYFYPMERIVATYAFHY
jgi:hypothetical protein